MSKPLQIEIVSDYVCPWCFVGKRRLEAAIAQRPELDVTVSWQPYQLSPDMPREGRKRAEHYKTIFGSERAETIMASMRDTGKDEGIDFGNNPDAMSPNTMSAHVLMLWAREADGVDADALAEKLFYAHHVECEDIGDHKVLARIASEVGLNTDKISDGLGKGVDEPRIAELVAAAQAKGVSGVPFFVINGRYGLSGAQPAAALVAAFDQIATNESEEGDGPA